MDLSRLQQARMQSAMMGMNPMMAGMGMVPMQRAAMNQPALAADVGSGDSGMQDYLPTTGTSSGMMNRSINIELDKIAKIFSGPFLIFTLIFLGILIFFTLGNCVIYGILVTEDQGKNPKISRGYAVFMLAMNVIGLLLLSVLFVWIIIKFNSYKTNIQNSILRVSNYVLSCQEKGIKY